MKFLNTLLISIPLFYCSISAAQEQLIQLRKGQIASTATKFIDFETKNFKPSDFKNGVCARADGDVCFGMYTNIRWQITVQDSQKRTFQFEDHISYDKESFIDPGQSIEGYAQEIYNSRASSLLRRISSVNFGEFVERDTDRIIFCQQGLDLLIDSKTLKVKSTKFVYLNCQRLCHDFSDQK